MSGGSYNYLCWHSSGLGQQRGDIKAMAERLESGGYFAAARSTRDVLRLLDGAERAAQALEDVWHAVEWADSGDSSEDRVRGAVAAFSPWPPP
jgi:hypothetical protein